MERFDVQNVRYKRFNNLKDIKRKCLKDLLLEEPSYGTSASAIERTGEDQPKYIRITDFDDFGIDKDHKYMTPESYSEKHLLRRNDILFARTGATVGKTYFYDGSIGDAVFAGYCIRFRFNPELVLPKYVYWYTKTDMFHDWVRGIQRPSGQPNINKEEYKSYEIILPSIDKQVKLCSYIEKAILNRNKIVKQVAELIGRISQKFADNIGTMIPNDPKELYSATKLFLIKNNDTRRMDPKCYSKKFEILRKEIASSPYKKYTLKELILSNISGDWGKDDNITDENSVRCLVLRSTEISNKHNIEIREDKVQFRLLDKKKFESMQMEIGDIIVEKSGGSIDQPVGRVVYLDRLEYNDTPIAYSNFLTKLKVNRELVDPYYLFEYLRFVYNIGLTEVMQNQTNGIRNLIVSEFLTQTIIVPENNKEIGLKMKAIREQAKTMELEAEQEWQMARAQFEKELLGEQ